MVSLKQELENYPLIDLKSIEERNPNIPDNIKNSIVLYNKALESLKASSEDIAIIELKKAIALNSTFYEAMNLLGLCYMFVKDTAKAAEIFQRVIEAENNGIKASEYLSDLSVNDSTNVIQHKKKEAAKRDRVKKPAPATQSDEAHKIPNLRKDLFKYLTGFFAGMLVIFLICLPAILKKDPTIVKAADGGETLKQLQSQISSKENDYNKLMADYNALKKDMESVNTGTDYYKYALKLFEVEKLAGEKKTIEAADMLLLMNTIQFKGPEKEKFDSLSAATMPKAADVTYDEGFKFFNSKKYEDAIKKFDKTKLYKQDFARMDGLLYYSGKCYQELRDSRSALACFQKLIENYPQSRYAKYAKYRIAELTENP